MRKGIFIPDITVEMFKNASLEAVEELLVSGTMEDIEIPDRPRGEWIDESDGWQDGTFMCSSCQMEFVLIEGTPEDNEYNFCPNCGADMRIKNDRSWDTSSRGVSGSVENSISQKEGDEK